MDLVEFKTTDTLFQDSKVYRPLYCEKYPPSYHVIETQEHQSTKK